MVSSESDYVESNRPNQLYSLGDEVKVTGLIISGTGTVGDSIWMYSRTDRRHMWGYEIEYDANRKGPVPPVPETFLTKLEDEIIE